MPNSWFTLHGLAPPKLTVCALFLPLIHGLCAFFRPLLTPVSTAPFFANLSVHRLHFTVYAPFRIELNIFRGLKCWILMVASTMKDPTMIMVTVLCERILSERALRLLLSVSVPMKQSTNSPRNIRKFGGNFVL